MPTRIALSEEFGVSVVTLQHVFDTLRQDGFIESRQRAGTFVNASPPFLNTYALVFLREPGAEGWSRFHQALLESATRISGANGKTIRCYYNVDADIHSPDYRRLAADSEAQRIAGQIFATFSPPVSDPAFRPAEIPGVVIALPEAPRTGRAALVLDYTTLWQRAADFLVAHGRRRVAVLHDSPTPDGSPDPQLRRIFEAHGLELPPHATIMLHPYGRQGAAQWVRLLMQTQPAARPNALFVADDNFTEPVIKGLVQAGVRVPEDVLVVAHNNFPLPVPDVLPIAQVGFNADAMLRLAMDNIACRRGGREASEMMSLAPEFVTQGLEVSTPRVKAPTAVLV